MIFEILKFSNLEISEILQFGKLTNLYNLFQFEKLNFGLKNWEILEFSSIRYFTLLAILPILNFDALTSQFLFPISVTLVSSDILHSNVR